MKPVHMILIHRGRVRHRLTLVRLHLGLIAGGVLVCAFAAVAAGYLLETNAMPNAPAKELHALRTQLAKTSASLRKAKLQSRAGNETIADRMAQLNAEVNRLDAIAADIARITGLNKGGEFNFTTPPGEGGPLRDNEIPWTRSELSAATNAMSERLWGENEQLSALRAYLLKAELHSQIVPHGNPVNAGWISSGWGWRPNPFHPHSGEREFHPGIDFADLEGSPVHAIAAGIVTWAGPRYGYGKLVIVNDGDGYTTYYAHDEKILVSVGQIVKCGARIALVGNTGRSTGPHLFLEVRYKGHPIDPAR